MTVESIGQRAAAGRQAGACPTGAQPVVIVKIINGLGNQLFQYAFGRRTALKIGARLLLDASGFQNYALRSYRLDRFNIVEQFASTADVVRVSGQGIGGTIARARRLWQRCLPRHKRRYIKERHWTFSPALLNIAQSTYLDGYWQSEKYFLDVAETIRAELTFKNRPSGINAELLKRIAAVNSVNLHVRRGDYVSDPRTNRIHGTCPLDYYRAAVDTLMNRVSNPHFFVFSDDMEWTRHNLRLNCPTTYVDHNGAEHDDEDLRLMTHCRHHIIANSSFSWWGAWLCPHTDKLVIAPRRWFREAGRSTRDLIPESWQQL